MRKIPKITYISWAPYCSRSDNTAREFGGKSYMVYYEFLGSNYFTILLKYFIQTIQTFYILAMERPNIIFVMSPTVFANIPIYIYCVIFRKKYIIDAHTGALLNPMWKSVRFLQKFFCRHALFTIVTNTELESILKKWKCNSEIIPDVPIEPPTVKHQNLDHKTNITLINTFAKDEPLDIFLESAALLPNVQFFVTGKIHKNANSIIKKSSSNVNFTNFLSNEEYYGLLTSSDLIVVLTTQDNTMQRGAYEAIYLGKPIVTSDWTILRDNFTGGAIFVNNDVKSITKGITIALDNLEQLTSGANTLKEKKKERWKTAKQNCYSHFNKK